MSGRVLAIDFGWKRVGLAISDPLGITAQPLGFIPFVNLTAFYAEIGKIVREKSVTMVLMGLPKKMDGTPGSEAEEIARIADSLRQECAVAVQLCDERLTTMEAEKMLVREFDLSREKRKKARDTIAACLILQTYLSSDRSLQS